MLRALRLILLSAAAALAVFCSAEPRSAVSRPAEVPPQEMVPLPGDGGDPARAFLVFWSALGNEDTEKVKSCFFKGTWDRFGRENFPLSDLKGPQGTGASDLTFRRGFQRGRKAVIILEGLSPLMAKTTVAAVARMLRDEGKWKIFRLTWAIAPQPDLTQKVTPWLEELPSGDPKALEAVRKLEARGYERVDSELHNAMNANDPEAVQLLLDAGIPPDEKARTGSTPLYKAVFFDCDRPEFAINKLVSILIKAGANVNEKDEYGVSMLDRAIRGCSPGILRMLVDAGAKVDRSMLRVNLDKLDNAEVLARAVKKEEAAADIVEAALQHEDREEWEDAAALYQMLIRIDPGNARAMNSLAGLYGKQGNYADEILWAEKALSVDPGLVPATINYGNALLELGRYEEAEAAFRRAADAAPSSPLGTYSLGLVAEKRKDLEQAIAFYQKSVEIDPKFQNGYFNLAAAYANLGKYPEAVETLKRLLRLNPKDREARAMLRRIEQEEAKRRG